MQIKVDDVELFSISQHAEDVIKDYVNSDIYDDNMKERLQWVINEIYAESFKRLKIKWEPILIADEVDPIPTDEVEFANLVFAHEDYMDRKTRDDEAQGE